MQKDRKIDLLRKHIAAKREAAAAAARAKEEEESRRLEAASGAANGNLRSDNMVVNVTDAVREEIVRGETGPGPSVIQSVTRHNFNDPLCLIMGVIKAWTAATEPSEMP